MNHERAKLLIHRFHEGAALGEGEWEDLRSHLRGCEDCKRIYDRLAHMEAALSGGTLVSEARVDRMRSLGPPPARSNVIRMLPRIAAPVLALAAAVALYVVVPEEDGFRSRGGGRGDSAWITTYEVGADGAARALSATLRRGRPLAFAYTTLSASPYRYLAIVGLDAEGRAHWYHPAYTGEPAASVPIEPGRADFELKEDVTADHALGKLEICGLFTQAPIEVASADRDLEQAKKWPEAMRSCVTVEVVGD